MRVYRQVGSETVKVVPFSRSLVALMVPSFASTMLFAMARPRPKLPASPGAPVVRALSER